MENEYIRKDHAIRLAESIDGEHRGKDWLVAQLEMIHPADVRPVVRGGWRFEEQGPEDYEQFWRCPFCAEKTYFITNFCPNCGADMREEPL